MRAAVVEDACCLGKQEARAPSCLGKYRGRCGLKVQHPTVRLKIALHYLLIDY